MQSEALNELAAALAKAQGEMRGAHADSANPFFKSNYADLQSIWEAIRDPLTKYGLSVVQTVGFEGPMSFVTTTLLHSSGQWISGRMPLLMDKQSPQAMGSAISYSRRYSLAALVGIYQIDDDGEKATSRETPSHQEQTKAYQTPAAAVEPSMSPQAGYVIGFGKHKGKTIAEIGPAVAKQYADWLQNEANKSGKALGNDAKTFINEAYKTKAEPRPKYDDHLKSRPPQTDTEAAAAHANEEIPF